MLRTLLVLPDGSELYSGGFTGCAIRSATLTSTVNSETELSFNSACCDMLEVDIWAPDSAQPIKQGDEVMLYRVSEAGTRAPGGPFICELPTKASANVYKITAYDRMSKADIDASEWLSAHAADFPLTLDQLAGIACEQAGLELATTALPRNGSYQVRAFAASGITWRQVLAWIAEASATFCHMNTAGKVDFRGYKDLTTQYGVAASSAGGGSGSIILAAQPDGRVLMDRNALMLELVNPDADVGTVYSYFQGALKFEDYTTAIIDKVQIKQTDNDVGVIYPAGATGENAYVVQGNLLLTTDTDANLRPVAQALYTAIAEISYTPFSATIAANVTIPAGSIITARDAAGRRIKCYVMSSTTSGQRTTLEGTGSPRRDSTGAVNVQSYRALTGKVLEIDTSVDGLRITAAELDGRQTEVEQTTEALTVTVSGVDAAQNAQKLTFDNTGLTIKNGGFRIQNADNQNTFSVTEAGACSMVGKLTTDEILVERNINGSQVRVAEITTAGYTTGVQTGVIRLYNPSGVISHDFFNSADGNPILRMKNSNSTTVFDFVVTGSQPYFSLYNSSGSVVFRVSANTDNQPWMSLFNSAGTDVYRFLVSYGNPTLILTNTNKSGTISLTVNEQYAALRFSGTGSSFLRLPWIKTSNLQIGEDNSKTGAIYTTSDGKSILVVDTIYTKTGVIKVDELPLG